MGYQEYVLEVFRDHHDCIGASSEEIDDMINETSFEAIEKWLQQSGYNLSNHNNCLKF